MVHESEAAHADAGGELLNAFNVATFKSEEDDVAFWNRLIPVAEQKPGGAGGGDAAGAEPAEELGIRAARLKNTEDVRARCLALLGVLSWGFKGLASSAKGMCPRMPCVNRCNSFLMSVP